MPEDVPTIRAQKMNLTESFKMGWFKDPRRDADYVDYKIDAEGKVADKNVLK